MWADARSSSGWETALVAGLKKRYETETGRYDSESVFQCTEQAIHLWKTEWAASEVHTAENFEEFYNVTKNRYKMSMSTEDGLVRNETLCCSISAFTAFSRTNMI